MTVNTPFGGGRSGTRHTTPGALAAEAAAKAWDGLPDAIEDHWMLLRMLKRSWRPLGLSRHLYDHLSYLVEHTCDADWRRGSRPVVWESIESLAEEFRCCKRTIRNRERGLAALGFLTWRDSANLKRYGSRDASGSILYAYGVDLSPLAAKAGEMLRAAEAEDARRRERALEVRRRGHLRADIRRLLTALGRPEEAPGGRTREAPRAIAELQACNRELEQWRDALLHEALERAGLEEGGADDSDEGGDGEDGTGGAGGDEAGGDESDVGGGNAENADGGDARGCGGDNDESGGDAAGEEAGNWRKAADRIVGDDPLSRALRGIALAAAERAGERRGPPCPARHGRTGRLPILTASDSPPHSIPARHCQTGRRASETRSQASLPIPAASGLPPHTIHNQNQSSEELQCNASRGAPTIDAGETAPRSVPQTGIEHIRLEDVLAIATPRLLELLPAWEPPDWRDVIAAASVLRSEMGASKWIWLDGVALMGPAATAVAVIVAHARACDPESRVHNPGGFLRGCLRKAETNELHLHRTVFGLAARRPAPMAVAGSLQAPLPVGLA